MEILLWMCFYDSRWFFGINIPLKVLKYLWFIPLFVNLFLVCLGVYHLVLNSISECSTLLTALLYFGICSSLLIGINLIIIIFKIKAALIKDLTEHSEIQKFFPNMIRSEEYDHLIRREVMLARSGLILLLQGLINFIYSCVIPVVNKTNYTAYCDVLFKYDLSLFFIFLFYVNLYVFMLFILMMGTKIISHLMANICPRKYIRMSKMCYRKKSNYKQHIKVNIENSNDQSLEKRELVEYKQIAIKVE